MLDAGISTRRGIMCSHREEAYGNLPLRHPLPHSERAQDRCILLPLYEQMEAGRTTARCVRVARGMCVAVMS